MEHIASDLLSFLPSLIVALIAAGLPTFCKFVAGKVLRRMKRRLPEWLYILLDSFVMSFAAILRVLLVIIAINLLPFDFVGNEKFSNLLDLVTDLLIIFYLGLGCWRAAPIARLLLRSAQNHLDLRTNQTMGRFFENIVHTIVAMFTVIAMLDRVGVPVAGLLAGASFAGVAISLAAQATLNNLIAGIALVLERPFGIGDYIVLGSYEGTVEDISFRSTRIRDPSNIAISIENSKVAAEFIQNYDRRQSRLWQFTIGLTYDTPRDKIEKLTADLATMLQAQPDVEENGVSITLEEFNAYSIDLLCRVYVTKISINDFLQVKNTLNLKILDMVRADGCEFAFPTVTMDLPKKT